MSFSKRLYDEFDRFYDPNTGCVRAFENRDHQGATNLLLQANNPRNIFTTVGSSRAGLLHLAAKNNWTELCDELIRKYNCDPLMGDLFDLTPLHYAAKYGALDAMKCLISKHDCNAEVKAPTSFHRTPLHFAVIYSQVETLIYLLSEVKVNICTPDINGNTVSHLAVTHNNLEVLKLKYFQPDCSIQNHNGDTVLHIAVTQSNLEVVKHLLMYPLPDPAIQNCNGDTVLHIAVTQSNLEVVKCLLMYPLPDPAIQNCNGDTVLHIAVTQSNLEVVKCLLTYPLPDPTIQNCNSNTVLHIAVTQSNLEVVKCLLTYPLPDPVIQNCNGDTVLHIAVTQSNLGVVKSLLTYPLPDPSIQNCNGDTVLHIAVTQNNLEVVKYIIYSQPDYMIQNCAGNTVLHLAFTYNHNKIIKALLSSGIVDTSILTIMNSAGETPVDVALKKKCFDVVKLARLFLNSEGLDDTIKNEIGCSALFSACSVDRVDVVGKLLTHKNVTVSGVNKQGKSPLQVCCENENWKAATYLFSHHGCQPDREQSTTLLHAFCRIGDIDAVNRILSVTQANPNSKDGSIYTEDTPLHTACRCGHLEIVKCLLSQKNIDVMSRNKEGNTPLHLVSNTDILRALLCSNEVDITCKNKYGNTPLHTACMDDRYEVVKYLVNIRNVDPTIRNEYGNTPLHLARDGDVVKRLLLLPTVDPMCLNNAGDTPLLKACRNGLYNVIYELLYSGRMSENCVAESFSQVTENSVASNYSEIFSLFTAYNKQTQLLPHVLSTSSESPTVPVLACDLECTKIAGVFDTFMYYSAFICGETNSGKSSLVKMLSKPKKSFLAKIFASNRHPSITYAAASARSAGILPTRCKIKELGQVLFYEFAGPFEYHDSHAAVLGNLLQTSSPVFLILVNITHDEDLIEKQLYYWCTFVRNACIRLSRESLLKSCAIVVASHCDIIKAPSELSLKVCAIEGIAGKCLQGIGYRGCVPLNCFNYSKEMVNRLVLKLSSCFKEQSQSKPLNFYCNMFYSFLVTKVKKIAVTVSDLTDMISGDEIYSNLLYSNEFDMETLLIHLKERGLVYFQKNDSHFPSSWVAVSIEALPKVVCNRLFSTTFLQEHQHLSNSTGVIPVSTIAKEFPDLDKNTLLSLLTSLEFCHKIDRLTMSCIFTSLDIQSLQQISKTKRSSTSEISDTTKESKMSAAVDIENSIPEAKVYSISPSNRSIEYFVSPPGSLLQPLSSEDAFLFFPLLVNTEPPLDISITNGIGWCLWCSDQYQFLTTHFLRVLLLRLAYAFCLPRSDIGYIVRDDHIGGLARQCSVWKNGIYWLDEEAIEVLVEVSELNRCVLLLVSYEKETHVEHLKLRSTLIRTIISIQQEICSTVNVKECLVSPNQLLKLRKCNLSQLTVYPIQNVAKACVQGKPYIVADITPNRLSYNREERIKTDTLLLGDPYQVITSQPSVSHLISSLFYEEFAEHHVPISILSELKKIFGSMVSFAPPQMVTYSSLRNHLNKFSILARPGTSPIVSISIPVLLLKLIAICFLANRFWQD